MEIKVSWSTLKGKNLVLSYIQANGNYYVYAPSGDVRYCSVFPDSGSSATDFDTNYRAEAQNLG